MDRKTKSKAGVRRLFLWKIVLCALSALCWFYALTGYDTMEDSKIAVIDLQQPYLSGEESEEILEKTAALDSPSDICFYQSAGVGTVRNSGKNRECQVMIGVLAGDSALYSRQCGALGEEDKSGCVLSLGAALDLFGSRSVVGQEVVYGKRTYQVRQVADWDQSVLLIRSDEADAVYTRIFLRPQSGESMQAAVENFLMSYGLTGTLEDDGWLFYAARFMLLLPCLAVGLFLAAQTRRQNAKSFNEQKFENRTFAAVCSRRSGFFWAAARYLIFAAMVVLLVKTLSIPADCLPEKWSDFSFWPRKWKEFQEDLTWYLLYPRKILQLQNLVGFLKTAAGSLFFFILFGCGILAFY